MKLDQPFNYGAKALLAAMLIAGTTVVSPLKASADTTSFGLDTLYSGTSPGPSTPWVAASFTDVSANTVLLTLTANNLGWGEYVDTWYFNLATNMNSTSLNIVKTNLGTGTVTGTVLKGNNTLASGGAGNFDFGFDFSNSGTGKFSAGDSVVYLITGISGLNAGAFNYASQGGDYFSASKISGIFTSRYCGSSTYGKIGDNTNSNPAPEPATMAILGSFIAVGAYLKKKSEKSTKTNS